MANAYFESIEEAQELNSVCAFCGKEKFQVVDDDTGFYLVRCGDALCEDHCKFDHGSSLVQMVSMADDDMRKIAMGH